MRWIRGPLEPECQIARDAGLDPELIPRDDFIVEGDTIRYRYVLLDADGQRRTQDNLVLRSEWMTAKVGGAKDSHDADHPDYQQEWKP